MKIEKDEVRIDHIKKCCDCNKYIFEGMVIYYIEINSLREDILLCEDCIGKMQYMIDKSTGNEI